MRPVPAPQIIDGEEWMVRDSGDSRTAFVDFSTKTMVVPMDGTPVGDLLRAHETAHVAITPRDGKAIEALAEEFPNRTLQACEDARVWVKCELAGIDTSASTWTETELWKIAAQTDREEIARCLMARRGTGDYANLRKEVSPDVVAAVESLYEHHFGPYLKRNELPPFDATVEMARALHEWAEAEEEPEPTPGESGEEGEEGEESKEGEPSDADGEGETKEGEGEPKGEGDGPKDETRDLAPRGDGKKAPPEESKMGAKKISRPFVPGDLENTKEAPKVTDQFITSEERKDLKEVLGQDGRGSSDPISDANFRVVRPKLTERHLGKGFGYKSINSTEGSTPRRMNRLTSDGSVFGRKVHSGYGTILIDVSGSMSLTPAHVEKLVALMPHSLIAQYSGDEISGLLTVLAEGGRRVKEIPRQPYGNVVDLQAIQWLCKQRGPRFWICDGVVTGRHDGALSTLWTLKIVRLCKLNRIKRFGSIESFKRFREKSC